MTRLIALMAAAIVWSCIGFSADAVAQQKTIKEQLVGLWALVDAEAVAQDGSKVPFLEGEHLAGLLIFDGSGHYSFQIIVELPKFASNNRLKTTAEENKALANGVQSFFGTYSISESDKILTLQVERNTFPNQNGQSGKRLITLLTSDELKFSSIVTGGRSSNNFVWKRIK
jgi:hypothetical protein